MAGVELGIVPTNRQPEQRLLAIATREELETTVARIEILRDAHAVEARIGEKDVGGQPGIVAVQEGRR